MDDSTELEYVGFWARVWATIIDSVLMLFLIAPLAKIVYGHGYFSYEYMTTLHEPKDILISYVLPALVVISFWSVKHATPGKMAIGAKIVDAKTGGAPSLWQHVLRYLGYFVSIFPACLGLLWVAFDSKKQGWHDKLAGTVVVRPKKRGTLPVRFE
jgi:uncharacterized RDD family membrane protein YckC